MDWIRERLLEVGVEPSSILVGGFRRVISIILILIAMKVLMGIGNRVIQGFFERGEVGRFSIEERRQTPFNHPKSVLGYIIYFIGFLTIASQFVDVTSLIAVAGVGSLPLVLVHKAWSGMWSPDSLSFEDQYSVGDYISAGSFSGIVEAMGLERPKLGISMGTCTSCLRGDQLRYQSF